MTVLYYSGHNDKDLIAAAFSKWGIDLGKHISGGFAAVINDSGRTYLIRDGLGTEPLFYSFINNTVYYSGSISEVLSMSGQNAELNRNMVPIYLGYGFSAGEETFYRNVKKVLPGTCVICDDSGEIIETYKWFMPKFEPDESLDETTASRMIIDALEEVMSDESADIEKYGAGLLLSSGVDSAFLLASSSVRTAFSLGYERNSKSESSDASAIAEYLNRDIKSSQLGVDDYFSYTHKLAEYIDQPLTNASAPAFLYICTQAKKHTDLLYSGEGADEIFGGYYGYEISETIMNDENNPYIGADSAFSLQQLKSILKGACSEGIESMLKACRPEIPECDSLSKMQLTDIQLILDNDSFAYISCIRRMLNMDIRVPFSDMRIFKAGSVLPSNIRIRWDGDTYTNKYAFRKAASNVLPREVAFRQKKGFYVPVSQWMAEPDYREQILDTITDEISREFFNVDELKKIWNDFLCENGKDWNIIYAVYFFNLWYRKHFCN